VGAVTQSGTWSVGLAAGSNAIGSVSVSNLPATQPVSVSLGGTAVSSSNRLPVSDSALDALVSGGALTIGGTVSLSAARP
jgi:hypothetical protein